MWPTADDVVVSNVDTMEKLVSLAKKLMLTTDNSDIEYNRLILVTVIETFLQNFFFYNEYFVIINTLTEQIRETGENHEYINNVECRLFVTQETVMTHLHAYHAPQLEWKRSFKNPKGPKMSLNTTHVKIKELSRSPRLSFCQNG